MPVSDMHLFGLNNSRFIMDKVHVVLLNVV